MNRDNWDQEPAVRAWLHRANRELRHMVKSSTYTIALMSGGEPDSKQAVELGFMILLDKPIILAVTPGTVVPDKLVKVADRIVEVDLLETEESQQKLHDAIESIEKEREKDV
jgi:nucleoside 2-deoxyribosyltransferase